MGYSVYDEIAKKHLNRKRKGSGDMYEAGRKKDYGKVAEVSLERKRNRGNAKSKAQSVKNKKQKEIERTDMSYNDHLKQKEKKDKKPASASKHPPGSYCYYYPDSPNC